MSKRLYPGDNCNVAIEMDFQRTDTMYADDNPIFSVYSKSICMRVSPTDDSEPYDLILDKEQAVAIGKMLVRRARRDL